jgi:hypothetical protein
MSTRIDEYREAKNTYFKLRNQAKKELIARFHELAQELLQLQRELLEDFGEKIAIPAKPKKSRGAAKLSKPGNSASAPSAPAAAVAPSPKVLQIQKQLAQQKKKLGEVQGAGKPTKAVEDRIYELEDELRLAQGK